MGNFKDPAPKEIPTKNPGRETIPTKDPDGLEPDENNPLNPKEDKPTTL